MNEIQSFQKVGVDLFTAGLNNSHSGNMSMRLNRMLVITRTSSMLHRLEHGDLIETLIDGEDAATRLASREIPVHRAIYRTTKADAVVHAHPPHVVALSLSGNCIQPLDAEGAYYFPMGIPVVAVRNAVGSDEVAGAVPPVLKQFPIVVVKGHGTFSIGETLEECLHWTSCLDNVAKIILLTRQYSDPGK
ncbi:MAG: class II aldolase/adducin family protein [Candidatus Riflebacteria bacterium]|nr:class II aldolase/adducin family protein [Candidatus Riflebacteria bacterium]